MIGHIDLVGNSPAVVPSSPLHDWFDIFRWLPFFDPLSVFIDLDRNAACYAVRGDPTSRLIAQMKAASSRATAVATTVRRLPLRSSARKRRHSRVWAFHAISRTRLGAAATFACFSRPTRAGWR